VSANQHALFRVLKARHNGGFYLESPTELVKRVPAAMSSFLVDYPFANRLYPASLDVLERFRSWGQTVILSDGDVVFQPRKVGRSGIFESVQGNVLIYIHKEEALDDVEQRYPAEHYVLVDDKLRILTTVKKAMRSHVTTVFVRQGQYAHDQNIIAECPPADLTVERIGDVLDYDLAALLAPAAVSNFLWR
jgi:FMN phosphatase YigB (HAD superfamily)